MRLVTPTMAASILTSSAPHTISAISARQAEILALVADGMQNKQIAHRLGISEATVKAHISKTIQISGCRNRVSLALLWLRHTGRLMP